MGTSRLDPSQYTVLPKVAVVDEFDMPVTNPQTGETEYFPITKEFLERIAANGNRREAETGDLCPLVIGKIAGWAEHTKRGLCETSQPEIVGYARNWTVDRFANTGRAAVFADFWVKNDEVERVKKFPRRSAEIWRGRAEIDPISLLGATTPERDLGMLPIALTRSSEADQEISTPGASDMPADDTKKNETKKDDTSPNATPKDEDILGLLQKIAAGLGDLAAKMDQMTGGSGGDGQTSPTGAGPAAGPEGAGGEPAGEMSDEELEKLIAELEGQGGGAPGGENVPPRKEETPVQSMGYPGSQPPAQLSRSESAEVARMREELEALKLERVKEDVARRIDKAIAEGVLLSPEERDAEIRDIVSLPAEMRPLMLQRIETKYRKAPIGGVIPAVADAANARGVGSITEKQRDEVVQLARQENTTFEVAFKKKFGRFPWETPARI